MGKPPPHGGSGPIRKTTASIERCSAANTTIGLAPNKNPGLLKTKIYAPGVTLVKWNEPRLSVRVFCSGCQLDTCGRNTRACRIDHYAGYRGGRFLRS